jgi:hypothetical protein
VKRLLLLLTTLALAAPASAFARGEFDPTVEFEQHEWVPIHLGPLNLSITKAVVYLMLGTLFTILLGLGLAAALVYALAYSAELGLSLVAYYTGPLAGRPTK